MAPAVAPRAGGCGIPVGTAVRLHGLKAAATLNGQEGVCVGWDGSSGRIHVRLDDGEVKAIKPVNLWKIHTERKIENGEAERVKALFRKYDTNGDGVIDQIEFRKFLHALGLNVSCMSQFLECVDANGDGAIQYEEFVDWVLSDNTGSAPSGSPGSPLPLQSRPTSPSSPMENGAANAEALEDSDSDDDDDKPEVKDLTTDDVKEMCGALPYGWPENGVKIVNNMRRRFPDYPVQRIVATMKQQNFHGGNIIQAIRKAGAVEVEVTPPCLITTGRSGKRAFPALYQVRHSDPDLKVYDQSSADFSFRNLRSGRLEPSGSIKPGERFKIIEARRDSEYGFCYGRIYHGTTVDRYHWVDLGKELSRGRTLMGTDLAFTNAERLDPA